MTAAASAAAVAPAGAQPLLGFIDGNWIDICSVLIAIGYAGWVNRKCFGLRVFGRDLANGTSLFPLAILGLSFLSSWLLGQLLAANKLILSIAGLCALCAVVDNGPGEKKPNSDSPASGN